MSTGTTRLDPSLLTTEKKVSVPDERAVLARTQMAVLRHSKTTYPPKIRHYPPHLFLYYSRVQHCCFTQLPSNCEISGHRLDKHNTAIQHPLANKNQSDSRCASGETFVSMRLVTAKKNNRQWIDNSTPGIYSVCIRMVFRRKADQPAPRNAAACAANGIWPAFTLYVDVPKMLAMPGGRRRCWAWRPFHASAAHIILNEQALSHPNTENGLVSPSAVPQHEQHFPAISVICGIYGY